MNNHKVVSHEEWKMARKEFLAKEKEFTRLRDELSAQRRALPWERVTKKYVFDSVEGARTLEQLFAGRSQLVVYHAMFDPKTASERTPYTKDAPCSMCSFWMDNFDRVVTHLEHRDVTLVAASRAPVDKLAAYKKRMGWTFQWLSVGDGDFNRDYAVTLTADEIANKSGTYNYEAGTGYPIPELPGISVFCKDGPQVSTTPPSANVPSQIFHTYSTYARGLDMLNVGYHYLDIVPKGRDEEGMHGGAWVRRRDEYAGSKAEACH